ncbi:hypothetical protein TrST_g12972 [Triparma strigata]|uniref:Enoyl reductase (ER) domain-containing protein n=1 Tax=Triparma strigata TaxID=1606541 RepID=A0A9W7ERR8_9STRA|nr:hypothetical protein TrST_g12972 [Triparma strigata]
MCSSYTLLSFLVLISAFFASKFLLPAKELPIRILNPSGPCTVTQKTWTLTSRPSGPFKSTDATLETSSLDVCSPSPNSLIIKTETLGLDAFLRTMLDAEAFHGAVNLTGTLPAFGVGTVVSSGVNSTYSPGDTVMGMLGASNYVSIIPSEMGPFPVLPFLPPALSLGLLSLTTGLTAHVGIYGVLKPPRKGDTVVVSAAAGAVGSVAVQLAKRTGAKVIGVAGGEIKNDYLREELGVLAVDYKAGDLGGQLDELAPEGIDFFFDGAGGEVLDEVLRRINYNARVVICGAASQYSGNLNVGVVKGPSEYLKLAEKDSTMKGFVVLNYMWRVPGAMLDLIYLWATDKIELKESWVEGIEEFPNAMVKMFSGGMVGKILVKV